MDILSMETFLRKLLKCIPNINKTKIIHNIIFLSLGKKEIINNNQKSLYLVIIF